MADFDFDELDKAVAGALTPDEAAKEHPRQPSASQPTDAPARETSARKAAPATRRGSGRFMDVVHPSSDMRTKNAAFAPPNRSSQEKSQPESPENEVSAGDQNDSTQSDTQDAWNQPLESPFLPDAKVEKRPLGAFSEANETEGEASIEKSPLFEEPDELLLEAPDEPRLEATAMPDPIDFAAHASALSTETEDTGTSSVETLDAPSDTALEETHSTNETDTPVEEVSGPASISQQYTEQPSSAPSSGAVYDTETYHQPITPAPKKSSGLWVFIWILLLVILGAGAGVAFYLFILPMF